MDKKPWHGPHWPEGVPYEISGYEKPVQSLLDDTAHRYPEHVYTVFNGAFRTFSQVRETADRIACFLASRGIEKGDRVAIILPNLHHYPAIYFGILKAGAVCVTCNPVFTAAELNYQLKDSGASALFCMDHPDLYQTATKALSGTDVKTVVVCDVKSCLPKAKAFIGSLLGKIPKAGNYERGHLHFDDIIKTYRPESLKAEINPREDLALILYTGGTTGTPKGASLTHANLVFDLMALEEWLRVPHESGSKPEKLRHGGFHCYLGLLPWYHSFGQTVIMLAACRSGSRLVCIPDPRVGKPPFTDVLKAIEKYIDGKRFFLSGDIGHMDEKGYLHITDRKKDMIIVGGFKVYPKEVEEVLYTHPGVALAAVIGIPDPKTGEKVKAFLKLKPGETVSEEEILDLCRKNMAGYKRPRSVEFRDELPTSMVGKVLRRALREEELKKCRSV
jgi:acyl-CoA synthetase (AMP-forming)/AMP-acid ligase II